MNLVDLQPKWLAYENGRHGQGISFECPCCRKIRVSIPFSNPVDGGACTPGRKTYWERKGDDFATLTISPSIDGSEDGHWHGHCQNGRITGA